MGKHRTDTVMTVPAMTTHSRNLGPRGNGARGSAGDGLPALTRQANRKEDKMSEQEKRILETLKKAMPSMSEQEKGYFNGYADALVARKKAQEKEVDENAGNESELAD